MRLLLTRALLVLGGLTAATAASWAFAAASASADSVLGDATLENLGSDGLLQVSRAIGPDSAVVADAVNAGTVLGALRDHSVRTNMAASRPSCSADPLDCADALVDHSAIDQLNGSTLIGAISTDALIGPTLLPPALDPTTVTGVASPLRSEAPRSGMTPGSRTASGTAQSPDGTDGAPVHAPASVPPTVPVSPAGAGGGTGSSMVLFGTAAAMDQLLPGGKLSRVVHPMDVGSPNSLNAQPGVAPD